VPIISTKFELRWLSGHDSARRAGPSVLAETAAESDCSDEILKDE